MNVQSYFQSKTLPSLGLLAFRMVMGAAFILHGLGKVPHAFNWMGAAPVPGILQAMAAYSEFGGGIGLLLGLLTPLSALGLIGTMLGALLLAHLPANHPFVSPDGGQSYELPLTYLVGALLILLNSPGKFSVDYFLVKQSSKPTIQSRSNIPSSSI